MKQVNLTEGSIPRGLMAVAAPIIVGNILQGLVEVADLFFVGRLSPEAIAGVALSLTVIFVLMTVVIGLNGGTTAFVSRYYGKGDYEDAGRVLVQSLAIGFVFSVLISIVGVLWTEDILLLLGADAMVAAEGSAYLTILSLGIAALVEFWIIATFFQSIGDSTTPLIIIAIINILNIILNPVFIFGWFGLPAMGVAGAAMATVLTRTIGLCTGIALLSPLNAQMGFTRHLHIDPPLIRRILKVAIPNMVQSGIRSVTFLIMFTIVTAYGTYALSAYGIVNRLETMVLMPGFGIATAAAVMVGQNLGAGDPARAEQSVWTATAIYGAFMVAMTAFFLVFGASLVGFFDPSGMSESIALSYVQVVSPFYVFLAAALVLSFALNGAGDTKKPMYAGIISYFIVQIPLAILLPDVTGTGIRGVWYAMVVGLLVQLVALYLMFQTGKWKETSI
ncbi:MATE family efflux transporter [Methanomicrobiaceae archaeon CYW5]|uniref:MATE family efflux transporter n=1 Tax=Methanovulcanius yangii TaxID=1789227 RepID=UPI0029CA4ABB|nr:MATE family efflux transporter [Methanovulcanius yangii]MBT8507857.1 MATE family efflux transporter [Methanovulcanius yangii]